MPLLVPYGNELIRINPANNKIEYSTNRGASWNYRYSGSYCGTFRDLIPYGGNLLALTDKGVYYYTTYDNHQIHAVDMHHEDLDGSELRRYPVELEGEVKWVN